MKRVEIYTKGYCSFCHRAKALLNQQGIDYLEHDITRDPDGQETMMERAEGARTVPQIFIDGESIGGCDDLMALARSGDLGRLMATTPDP